MVHVRNARIVSAYSALFTVSIGLIVLDLYEQNQLPNLPSESADTAALHGSVNRRSHEPSSFPLTAALPGGRDFPAEHPK